MNESDSRIYLDNNSTTPIDPEVFEAMLFDLGKIPRNPSSIHSFGREGRNELTKARRMISDVLKVKPEELIFTSGATESNNFLLKGFLKRVFPKKVITSKLEHSSIYKLIEKYEKDGGQVHYLSLNENKQPCYQELSKEIKDAGLVVLMAVNNETGTKTDYQKIAALAKEYQVPYLVDGVALLGKEPLEIVEGITAMTFSGHKLHAPKGIGLAYLSNEYELDSLIEGGAQEGGLRAGTHNFAGILGLAKAIELLPKLLPEKTRYMKELRDFFESSLQKQLEGVEVNGGLERVCNTSNIAFLGVDGESLLMNLDLNQIAASHGSACSSGSLAPSRVLIEMGYPRDRVNSSIRFSFSRMTQKEEVKRAISVIVEAVKKMRE